MAKTSKSSFWKVITGEEGLNQPITYGSLLNDIVWIAAILIIVYLIKTFLPS